MTHIAQKTPHLQAPKSSLPAALCPFAGVVGGGSGSSDWHNLGTRKEAEPKQAPLLQVSAAEAVRAAKGKTPMPEGPVIPDDAAASTSTGRSHSGRNLVEQPAVQNTSREGA